MPRRRAEGVSRRGNKTPGSIARGRRLAVHLTTYLIFELGRG